MAELTGKTIAELPEATSLAATDLFPLMKGSTSRRATWDTMRANFYRMEYGTALESGTNIDELLTPGTYAVTNTSNITGGTPPPTSYMYKLLVVRANNSSATPRLWQVALAMGGTTREYRRNYDGGWGDWHKVIMDDEFETLKTTLGGGNIGMGTVTVPRSSTAEISMASGERALVVFSGAGVGARGAYILNCSTSETHTVNFTEITAASNLTLTSGTLKVTVTNASADVMAVALVIRF